MKLTKKQEYAITVALVGILVAYFIYQVAFATNESSYRKGFNEAKTDWNCLATSGDCDYPYFNSGDVCYPKNIDNMTACNDGYIAGFVNWCGNSQAAI
jgi:hypothetical protein